MIKLFLANKEKYNQGELVGKWVELPVDLDNDEEYIIHDYQTDIEGLRIRKHDSIQELSELCDAYDFLSIQDQNKVSSIMEWEYYSDISNAIYHVNNFVLIESVKNDEDYGNYVIEKGLMGEVPEWAIKYLDIERLGNDTYNNFECFYSINGLIMRKDMMNIY